MDPPLLGYAIAPNPSTIDLRGAMSKARDEYPCISTPVIRTPLVAWIIIPGTYQLIYISEHHR